MALATEGLSTVINSLLANVSRLQTQIEAQRDEIAEANQPLKTSVAALQTRCDNLELQNTELRQKNEAHAAQNIEIVKGHCYGTEELFSARDIRRQIEDVFLSQSLLLLRSSSSAISPALKKKFSEIAAIT